MRIPPQLARKPVLIGASIVSFVMVVGLITWAVSPKKRHGHETRERQYKTTTACLLTDDQGITGDLAKAVWAGMREASLETRIKVQYLAITGPRTAANGVTYYNTLGLRECAVILAAGETPTAAMVIGADQFKGIDNIAVGASPTNVPTPNDKSTRPSERIVTIDTTTPVAVQRRVKEIVSETADR